MTAASHNRIRRHGYALRLAALALALYAILPSQLVWCHEDGRSPRMEAAFNGQCLALAGPHCCGDEAGEPGHDQNMSPAASLAVDHEHCLGCSDQPAHHQQATHSTGTHHCSPRIAAGCLFSLSADISAAAAIRPAGLSSTTQHCIRELPLLHARTTCLLI